MQIEGIIHNTPQPHLELAADAALPEGPLIIMLQTQLFKQKAERKGQIWTLELPEEVCSQSELTEGKTVNLWLLDPEQRGRIIHYAEQGVEDQRIRRIDKIVAMLYERRTL